MPWAHESTHLGDEYTILASSVPGFERINVSYEYQEYGISYGRSFGRNSLLTARLEYSFHHPLSGEERRRPTWTVTVGRTALARQRSVVASMAAMAPGTTAKDSALDALAGYIELFGS